MALTQADIDRLETALATGELTVEYDGKRVTFRSVDEIQRAISYARARLAEAAGADTTQSYLSFSRD